MRILKPMAVVVSTTIIVLIVLTFWNQCFVNFVASEGDVKMMTYLLGRGVNLNQPCKSGYPLIAATQSGRVEMVSLLLKSGANPNVRDTDSSTALIWAAKQNNREIAAQLIDAAADVNLEDQQGASALWYAVRTDSYPIAAMLLQAGANTHSAPGGVTPLMLASQNRDHRIADLLAHGQDQPRTLPIVPHTK